TDGARPTLPALPSSLGGRNSASLRGLPGVHRAAPILRGFCSTEEHDALPLFTRRRSTGASQPEDLGCSFRRRRAVGGAGTLSLSGPLVASGACRVVERPGAIR